MPFVKIEKRVGIADAKPGASVSLRARKGAPTMPGLFVVLRKAFLEATGLGSHAQFDLEVGEGEDAGKIRIVPAKKGIFGSRLLKHGTLLFDFGHIAQLGTAGHRSQDAEVAFVDGAALVTIPEWPDEDDEDQDDEDAEDGDDEFEDEPPAKKKAPPIEDLPNPVRKPPAPPPPMNGHAAPAQSAAAPGKAKFSPDVVKRVYNGVMIDLTPNRESVSYKGVSQKVTPRGARVIESLARAMPNCIGEPQLIAFVWEGKPPQGASVALDMVCADLKSLKMLGLEVRAQKGIGRQLVAT